MMRKLFLTASLCSTLLSFSVYAQTTDVVIAPTCLYQQLDKASFAFLAKNKDYALIKVDEKGLAAFIQAKENHQILCGGFMNVTSEWQQALATQSATSFLKYHTTPMQAPRAANYRIQYQKEVNTLLQKLDPQDMWTDLTTFTQFSDRYAYSDNGVKAANWLIAQVEQLANKNGRTDISYATIPTPGRWFQQPSVVVKVGTGVGPGIVIGAHMDTLFHVAQVRPGADDDGTGTVTVLETLRLILNSPLRFKKPIYFIWYAAEEEGDVGSQAVVKDFMDKKIPIDAVIQFDMTGYQIKNDRSMWLIDDYVNKSLSDYTASLISVYVKQPVKHTQCGYACSDHASWTQKGYAASMPAETAFSETNPNMHTANDTLANLSRDHMTDYAKLAVAFVVELAEPMNS